MTDAEVIKRTRDKGSPGCLVRESLRDEWDLADRLAERNATIAAVKGAIAIGADPNFSSHFHDGWRAMRHRVDAALTVKAKTSNSTATRTRR